MLNIKEQSPWYPALRCNMLVHICGIGETFFLPEIYFKNLRYNKYKAIIIGIAHNTPAPISIFRC